MIVELTDLRVARILKNEHASCQAVIFAVFRGQCEGCDNVARHCDVEGVPLCCECDARLTAEVTESERPELT